MTPRDARLAIASIRLGVGLGAIAAPRLTGRLFGIDPDSNPSVPYLARLFGARELFMAAPVLLDPDGDHADASAMAIAVDGLDALAAASAVMRKELPLRALFLAGGAAVVAAILGVKAAEAT